LWPTARGRRPLLRNLRAAAAGAAAGARPSGAGPSSPGGRSALDRRDRAPGALRALRERDRRRQALLRRLRRHASLGAARARAGDRELSRTRSEPVLGPGPLWPLQHALRRRRALLRPLRRAAFGARSLAARA